MIEKYEDPELDVPLLLWDEFYPEIPAIGFAKLVNGEIEFFSTTFYDLPPDWNVTHHLKIPAFDSI